MLPVTISEADLRARASRQSFERGAAYFRSGAVQSLRYRDNTLLAEVEGSEPEPYIVQIALGLAGATDAACTCPYEWEDWCKHIVAALLAYIAQPENVEVQEPLEGLLARLSVDDLRAVLLRLSRHGPELAEEVRSAVASATAKEPKTTPGALVDAKAIRRDVKQTLRSLGRMRRSEAYWHVGTVIQELRDEFLSVALGACEDDEGNRALAILESLTEAYLEEWEELDDSDGEASAFFEDLGDAWSEALLTAQLSVPEAKGWAVRLRAWADGLEHDYGVGEGLHAAEAAATQVWQIAELSTNGRERATPSAEVISDEPLSLTRVRLNILRRQARHEDYLNLADEAGLTELHAAMLVGLGRPGEAAVYAQRRFHSAEAALSLVRLLEHSEAFDAAMGLAERALHMFGPKADLALWLRDRARLRGDAQLALRAAVIACKEAPELEAYLAVKHLAGPAWDALRAELLGGLKANRQGLLSGPVDILLHEDLVAEAIIAVTGSHDYRVIETVAAAAVDNNPDWVIEACRWQADLILNPGRSDLYATAVRWLGYVKQAYHSAGRQDEWRDYLTQLRLKHGRKYKLRPMLDTLRH